MLFLLNDVKQGWGRCFKAEHKRDEFSLVEFGRSCARAVQQVEADAYEQEFGHLNEVVPPFDLTYGILNEAFERRVGENRVALAGVV